MATEGGVNRALRLLTQAILRQADEFRTPGTTYEVVTRRGRVASRHRLFSRAVAFARAATKAGNPCIVRRHPRKEA